MPYQIEIAPAARRQIKKLPKAAQAVVIARLEALAEHSRPSGCRKLSSEENLYRVRKGDYRIVYTVQDARLVVFVASEIAGTGSGRSDSARILRSRRAFKGGA